MKTTALLILFTLICGCLMAQGDINNSKKDANTKEKYSDFGPDTIYGKNLAIAKLYQSKIDHYTSKKKTGGILAFSGVPFIITGVALIIVGDGNASSDNFDNDFDTFGKGVNQIIAGLFINAAGVAAFVSGLVLHGVGNRKIKEYQVKRDGLKINPYATLKSTGLTLTYQFWITFSTMLIIYL
jgi:hypothetical protein